MNGKVDIPFLGEKIELCLRSERTQVSKSSDLLQILGIGKDYLSRIQSGTRRLTDDVFMNLCKCFNLGQRVWLLPLFDFGKELGFSRREVAIITRTPVPGIDFNSRINDKQVVNHLFELIKGVWESFYFSVSRFDKNVVRKDILIIRKVRDDGFIDCEILEESISYTGVCFPIKGQLMFILEKEKIFNEIIVYCTNLPERNPPKLFGVLLCLSGGVDEIYTYPAAAKVGFRYMGNIEGLMKNSQFDTLEDYIAFLRKEQCGYLDPSEIHDSEIIKIVELISNTIADGSIPNALTMTGK